MIFLNKEYLIDNKELMKEWDWKKNKNLEPKNLTSGSHEKVWWKCKKEHEWEAIVHTRMKGVGCPYCAGKKAIKGINDLETLYPNLIEEWDFDQNDKLGIKPNEISTGSKKKVNWICNKGHKYIKSVYDKTHGTNCCPYCSNKKVLKGYNDLTTTNPELLPEWDYKKNTISPDEITAGAEKMIWWICSKGHSYQSLVYNRKKGVGCPYCAGKKVLIGYNDLATTNPDIAKEWDYKKNGNLKPTDITAGSHKKVHWKCQYGHEWIISVKERNMGQNCPYCSNKRVLVGFNDLYTYCINNKKEEIIKDFDKEKNSFTMQDVTSGSGKETWWKCQNGHSYKSTIERRIIRNQGCPICSHNILQKGYNDLATTNPEIAKEWDYKKNKVGPDEVMAGSNIEKYWFICPKGHSYKSTPLNRKKGNDCPQCNIENHTLFPERAIYYYMREYFNDVKDSYHNSVIGRKEIDVYLPKFNFGIEYDGHAWHKNYKRDLEKDGVCYKNGIELLRVREVGCHEYDSPSLKIYVEPYNMEDLNNAILFIFNHLNKKFRLKIKPDIDVDRDRVKILELMNLSEKEKSLANYCPNIEDYWDYEKNGIIKPEQISHASEKNIYLKCQKGHNWIAKAGTFVLRPYCPYCNGRKVWPGFNDLFTTNPELKILWSPNNTIDPKTIKKGSNKKVLWICQNCGKEYEMAVNSKKGKFCRDCSHKKKINKKRGDKLQ